MRKTTPERNKFRSIQQNILSPNSESYYATHYTGSTIRSVGYNEGRVSRDIQPAGFSSKDSIGLESMFPRIASDFFKVQIPKEPPPLPIQVHQIDRRTYNMAHDTVQPSRTSGLQIAQEPEYVDEVPKQVIPDVPEFIEPVAEKPLSRKERKALFAEQQSEAEQQRVKADEKRFIEERAKKDEINRKAREKRAQNKAEAEAEAEAEQAAALQKKPMQKIIKIKKAKA